MLFELCAFTPATCLQYLGCGAQGVLRAVPCPQDPCVPSCHSSIQLKLSPMPCHQLQRELPPSKGFADKSHCCSCPGSCWALWHLEWCGAGPGSRGPEGIACFWLLCFQQPLIPVTGFSYGRTCPGTLPCAFLLSWPAGWLQMGGFAPSLELCFFAIGHSQFGGRDAKAEASCRG